MYRKLIVLLTALMLLLAVSASAKGKGKGKRPSPEKHKTFLKDSIGLSDDQMKELEKIKIGLEKITMEKSHQIEKIQLSIKELAIDGKLSKGKIKELMKEIHNYHNEMKEAKYNSMTKSIDVFTDAQISKLGEKHMLGRFFHLGKGGKKGGKSRAEKLTPKKRSEIAKLAAQARWEKTVR